MIRAAALLLGLALALPAAADPGEEARAAAAALTEAIAALQAADSGSDRVAALTRTIRAYEEGLASLRDALRQAAIRETALTLQLDASETEVARLLAALTQIGPDPSPQLMFSPDGPIASVRSGMLIADVAPALQAGATALRDQLDELRALAEVQGTAQAMLAQGMAAAQAARTELSQAISERTDLPRRFTEDPAALAALAASADTLAGLADGLRLLDAGRGRFADLKGTLPLPVLGQILRLPDEADAAGVRRPGLALATRPAALVTSPAAATIRYLGPLRDYGNVMILEPGDGYLVVLSGLGAVYGQVGQVVAAGAPLGLMGGAPQAGDGETETLYLEVRQGTEPQDPRDWFTGLKPAE
jgi:septal ring factor EnvC (AmiA/AmiB activator)